MRSATAKAELSEMVYQVLEDEIEVDELPIQRNVQVEEPDIFSLYLEEEYAKEQLEKEKGDEVEEEDSDGESLEAYTFSVWPRVPLSPPREIRVRSYTPGEKFSDSRDFYRGRMREERVFFLPGSGKPRAIEDREISENEERVTLVKRKKDMVKELELAGAVVPKVWNRKEDLKILLLLIHGREKEARVGEIDNLLSKAKISTCSAGRNKKEKVLAVLKILQIV